MSSGTLCPSVLEPFARAGSSCLSPPVEGGPPFLCSLGCPEAPADAVKVPERARASEARRVAVRGKRGRTGAKKETEVDKDGGKARDGADTGSERNQGREKQRRKRESGKEPQRQTGTRRQDQERHRQGGCQQRSPDPEASSEV